MIPVNGKEEERCRRVNILPNVMSVLHNSVCLCVCVQAYRKHRGGEKTPCEKLQEDDHHSMVNTGLTDSLRLQGETQRGGIK